MEIQLIMRWHLVRVYAANQLHHKSKESYIEISMHPLNLKQTKTNEFLSELMKEKKDDPFHDIYSNWDLSDESSLAGTVREKTIIKYLFELTSVNKTLEHNRIPIRRNSYLLKERTLEEDMVFLQLCTDAKRFNAIFKIFKKRKGIFNIDPILTQSNSMLIDFTREARRMSSRIYQDVMET